MKHLALGLLGFVTLIASPVRADVGPIDNSCTVANKCPGKGVECKYVNSQPDAGELQCEADAKGRGLVLLCSRGGGTVGSNIYCPSGTPSASSDKGGCSVVSRIGGGFGAPRATSLSALAFCLALAAVRRRRPIRTRV